MTEDKPGTPSITEDSPGSPSITEDARVAPVHYYSGPGMPGLPGLPPTMFMPHGGQITPVIRESDCLNASITESDCVTPTLSEAKSGEIDDTIWVSTSDDKYLPTTDSYEDFQEIPVVIYGNWINVYADVTGAAVMVQLTDGTDTVNGSEHVNDTDIAPTFVRVSAASFDDDTYCRVKLRAKNVTSDYTEEVKNIIVTMGG